MKIGFIISSLTTGGAENQTVQLINSLVKRNYEIVLFVIKSKLDLINKLDSSVEVINLDSKKYFDKTANNKIKKEIEEKKIGIVFAVNSYPSLYLYFAARNTNVVKVIIQHTTFLQNFKEKIKNIYYKRIINSFDHRIFVSINQKNYWLNKYKLIKENSFVIHNGIDSNYFSRKQFEGYNEKEVSLKANIKDGDFVILHCAMFRPEKNHIELLTALKKLVDKNYTNIKVILVGDGVEKENIVNYIKNNGLENYVHLAGLQKDVRKYSMVSDVGVLPSKAVETFSLSALEQLAMGIPMIMSDIGGANEMIIQGYNGFLYNLKDVNELTRIIEQCYIDKVKFEKLKRNAINVVNETFTLNLMVEKYVAFIEAVVKEKNIKN